MYRLSSEHSTTRELLTVAGSDIAIGTAAVFASKLGFYEGGAANGELASFLYKAKRITCSCDDSISYTEGDAVYDAGTPSGEVNKTSTTGRRLVGYALKSYPVGTTEIEVEDFDGTRGTVA